MRILNLLVSGNVGGIERLCLEIAIKSSNENHFYFLWQGGEVADLINQTKSYIYVEHFKYRNFIKIYQNLRCYCKINNIDTIVTQHTSWVLWIYGILLKKELNCKLYIYAHSHAHEFLKRSPKIRYMFLKSIFCYTYKKCDRILAISRSVSNSLTYVLNSTIKIELCYNGIDLKKFYFCLGYRKRDLIYVGRLEKQKGVDILIKALNIMNEYVNLIIVGDGKEKKYLEILCKKMRINNRVFFAGTQHNIEKWLTSARIFVHPCRCKEGFGLTLVEAMASGTPCVAFNKGAIPEIIDDKINGFLVKEDSINALARALDETISLSDNTEAWSKIQYNARQKAEMFSSDKMIKRQEEIFSDL